MKKALPIVRRAFNISRITKMLFLTYLSQHCCWVEFGTFLLAGAGCQDFIGSNPSVFLDKNIFQERDAKINHKNLSVQIFLENFLVATL
jgi:hypothetical protein